MTERMGRTWLVVFAGAVAASISLNAQDDGKDKKDQKEQKKASLSLKATPPIAFSPARMVVSAELKGGSDETDDYYCPNLEWDWGDGTKSESNQDCAPFEAGKSTHRSTLQRVARLRDRRPVSRDAAAAPRHEDDRLRQHQRAGEAGRQGPERVLTGRGKPRPASSLANLLSGSQGF